VEVAHTSMMQASKYPAARLGSPKVRAARLPVRAVIPARKSIWPRTVTMRIAAQMTPLYAHVRTTSARPSGIRQTATTAAHQASMNASWM